MPPQIDKKTIEHLAELARIKLTETEKEKLSSDLANILGHFEELQKLDTSDVEPTTGGIDSKNVFREDGGSENTNKGAGVEAFPEKEKGYLKVPPVFGNE